MYPGGRYISSTTHPNIGSALSISDSANRDPVSSAILKASGNQQYRGKSPLPTAGSLPTHSYYTRSKSVCLHCSSIVDSLPSCVLLVIFQVLKGAANETHTWYALVDSRLSMQSRSHALLFSRQAVFFFSNTRIASLSRSPIFPRICSREILCFNNAGVPIFVLFYKKEQVFSLSLMCVCVCTHSLSLSLLRLLTDAATAFDAFLLLLLFFYENIHTDFSLSTLVLHMCLYVHIYILM